ncbi:hypothetical protein NUW54_g12312 [Trametes sanguinea]|uniref:Uncharacterized protein n=1 Tax=Trametes sanguinea TaxID=158606 RepID=A0ACC1N014_9APHY|nr:hypothetical protein NUW54_g12312 [Trametes sanguinea]
MRAREQDYRTPSAPTRFHPLWDNPGSTNSLPPLRTMPPSPLALHAPTSHPFRHSSPTVHPPSSVNESRKRRNENEAPSWLHDTPVPRKRKYYTSHDKLSIILDCIYDETRWKLGDFLWALFDPNEALESTHDEKRRRAVVSAFLQGKGGVTPARIIDLWYNHPDGRVPPSSSEFNHMYSPSPEHFTEACSVRVALTSFATQVVSKQLAKEAERAVKPQHGLHASRKKKKTEGGAARLKLEWADVGSTTVSRVDTVIKRYQPLLRSLLLAVAERPNPVGSVRKVRPAETVVTNVISMLDFSRSNRANLLPTARALLHFALSAPYDLYHYNSRIGFMPAYSTVYRTLEELARQEAAAARSYGRAIGSVGHLWFDNVQNYLLQRDPRIGRVNALRIGTAATFVEAPDIPLKALDLDDKLGPSSISAIARR